MNERAIAHLGGYEVLAELETGGMGEVLVARKRAVGGFERLVALKTVRQDLADVDAARDMFLDEGRLLARLHHQGIAQVYDFGEDGNRLFLAMEYVAGIDFGELGHRRPPPRIACLAMAEAARALHSAHELSDHDGSPLGVVHRDVSPGNLMLTYDGSVKVLDFGIALMRNRRAPVTEFGMLKGKPPYMAPEQVRSEAIDPRTDVFSACAVLWELLTGERLFTGDSIFAIGRAIETGEVAPPSTHSAELPETLDALVLQGLAKNPDERFQSASSLATALESVARSLGGETLAEYARRELADDRSDHEAYISELVMEAKKRRRKVGRGTSVNTIPALDGIAGLDGGAGIDDAAVDGIENADTAPGEAIEKTPAEAEPDAPRRSRFPLILVAVGLLVTTGLGVWQFGFGGDGDRVAAVDVDAAAGPALADAGAPAPLDASDASDASLNDAAPTARDASVDAPVRSGDGDRNGSGARDKPPDTRPDKPPETPVKPRRADAGPVIVAPPVGEGTVTILVGKNTPYANVKIDGRSVGDTPIYTYELSAGPHTIVWLQPGSSAVRKRQSIVVVDGKHMTLRAD